MPTLQLLETIGTEAAAIWVIGSTTAAIASGLWWLGFGDRS